MRFEELVMTLPDEQIRVGFHERLTILGGLPEDERATLIESLLGAALGTASQTDLRAVDSQGRAFTWSTRGAQYADGSAARPLVPDLLPDVAAVRAALVVSSDELGLAPGRPDRRLEAELQAALTARTELDQEVALHREDAARAELCNELEVVDHSLVEAEDFEARAGHQRVLAALDRARSELAMIEDLEARADHDRALRSSEAEYRRLRGLGDDAQAQNVLTAAVHLSGTDDPDDALSRAASEAAQRDRRRATSRSPQAVTAEIERLDAEAASRWRTAWATRAHPQSRPPNSALLRRRRHGLTTRLQQVSERSRDLADRREAVRVRVRALEAQLGGGGADPATLANGVLARLTEARHRAGGDEGGSRSEPFPVVLDDTFVRVPPDRRTALLEMLLRLGERIQIVYMTQDPVVLAWARQRTRTAPMLLLEFAPG